MLWRTFRIPLPTAKVLVNAAPQKLIQEIHEIFIRQDMSPLPFLQVLTFDVIKYFLQLIDSKINRIQYLSLVFVQIIKISKWLVAIVNMTGIGWSNRIKFCYFFINYMHIICIQNVLFIQHDFPNVLIKGRSIDLLVNEKYWA